MGRFIDITGAPIVSDFQEMPLDFINQQLQLKQNMYDKDMLAVDEYSKLLSRGYEQTANLYEPLKKEVFSKLDEFSQKALQDPEGTARELTKWKRALDQNPAYLALKADEENKKKVLEDWKKANEKGTGIPLWRLEKTPLSYEKVMSGEESYSPDYYDMLTFEDSGEYVDKQLKELKGIMSSWGYEDLKNVKFGADNGMYSVNTSGEYKSNLLGDTRLIPGTKKTVGEFILSQLNSINNDLLTSQANAPKWWRAATKYGISDNYGKKSLEEAGLSYIADRYNKFQTLENTSKTSYDQMMSGADRDALTAGKTTTYNPWVSKTNTGGDFKNFITTATNSKQTRDTSWKGFVDGLEKTNVTIPGIKRNAQGVYTDYDAQNIINYYNSAEASSKYPPNSKERADLKGLYDLASTYITNNHQLKFYKNQLTEIVNKAWKKERGENAPEYIVNALFENKPTLKVPVGKNKKGEPTYVAMPSSNFINGIKEEFEKSLNIGQAYVLADKNGMYSQEGLGIATNIWDQVNNGDLTFEGMGKGKTSDELNKLFTQKTGEEPKGKLVQKGTALDGNGRLTVIVEDSETGKVAGFNLMPGLERASQLGNIYFNMAHSSDPMANSVGKQGLVESYLMQNGQSYKLDNLIESKTPITENILGLNITKEFGNFGPIYTFTTPKGNIVETSEKDLKTSIGRILIEK